MSSSSLCITESFDTTHKKHHQFAITKNLDALPQKASPISLFTTKSFDPTRKKRHRNNFLLPKALTPTHKKRHRNHFHYRSLDPHPQQASSSLLQESSDSLPADSVIASKNSIIIFQSMIGTIGFRRDFRS